jgi:putative phage-type endonuclease
MKSHLKLVPTRDMSQDDWLAYRQRGVGASEVGTILGLNPYKCSAQLFYEKLGEMPINTVENMAMFLGKEQESFIADLWQYWDPSDGGEAKLMENYRAGNKVRRCQRVNAYVNNPDFPWLFVSLDRKINKGRVFEIGSTRREVSLETEGSEGSLELKTIAGHEADKWEAGIPPSHVVQVQTQLLVCEFKFGELAVFKDGRDFQVYPFEYNPGICETIIERTRDFWQRVLEGRKLLTQRFEMRRNFNYQAADEITEQLTTLEPAPDGSEAFAKYLKERYRIAEPGEVKGTDEQLATAARHKRIKEQMKALEEQARECENILKNSIREDATKIDFTQSGYVSWKPDSNGVRKFLNKVKGG